jgi:hypothetical protein
MSELKTLIRDAYHQNDKKPSTLEQAWKTKHDLETFAATRPDFLARKNDMFHLLREDKFGNAQISSKNGKLNLEAAYNRACHPTVRDTVFLTIQGLKDKS